MANWVAATTDAIEQREITNGEISHRLAGECMVLLENDGALPIASSGKVALYGNGARHTVKGGTGSGDVNSREVVNIEEALEEGGYTITTKGWLDRQDAIMDKAHTDYIQWVRDEVKRENTTEFMVMFSTPYKEPGPTEITDEDVKDSDTDTALFVISRNSGEGADRYCDKGDYLLFDEEVAGIKKIAASYDKAIVILNIGGIIDAPAINAIEGVNAVLLMSQLSATGSRALVDALCGKVNPSGKLADTWAKDYWDYPSSAKFGHNEKIEVGQHGGTNDEEYTDGIYVGYRYFDTFGKDVEYPFGYGLSYTTFDIKTTAVKVDGEEATVTAKVKNTGAVAGKEVVQVYASAPDGKIDKPVKVLVGYTKTSLIDAGAEEDVTVAFNVKDMASYYPDRAEWVLDAGDYVILVGNSSADAKPAAVISLAEEAVTKKCKNLFALDIEMEEIKPASRKQASADGAALSATIDPSAIKCQTVKYTEDHHPELTTAAKETITADMVKAGKYTVEDLVAQLTVEEMATLCVGTLRAEQGTLVGNASSLAPGAAADTTSVLEYRGVQHQVLADGPAGLRLQPLFKTTKDGEFIPGGSMIGEAIEPWPEDLDESNVVNYYQYCTAIPIGWALAQSWNKELVSEAGDMVGGEMERFGVDVWLAPAMNIHRNPLCGRNFEYYSEDPVLAGNTAAAMVSGVQKHHGRGVSIKHYAVNNQEDNRYFVNAHVPERALREVYLRGFGICIEKSDPMTIMSSYNLLNGTHTAANHDLIQGMARDEYGFGGYVMTDWYASQDMPAMNVGYTPIYPITASTGCIYAGNDAQMPGCQKNVDDIVKGVETGQEIDGFTITKGDLQFCAANIVRVLVDAK